MKSRSLKLRKETLVELSNDDLRHVVGATHLACGEPTHGGTTCDRCPTVPVNECRIKIETERYAS